MTTEEKLRHFQEFTMQDARNQSSKLLDEYKASLESIFEEHKEHKLRQAQLEIKTEADSLTRNKNKELSKQQLHIKRKLNRKQEALKDKLFVEVRNLLSEYMDTPEYDQQLIRQIKEAKQFARGEEITIYIDPADSSRLASLEVAANTPLTISEYSFSGGMRAVIPGRKILIDNSYMTKLAEAKENFTFNGGISNE